MANELEIVITNWIITAMTEMIVVLENNLTISNC